MSKEHLLYLKKLKRNKKIILFFQLSIISIFLIMWQILSDFNIINSFIFSSPISIFKTIIELFNNNNLFIHIFTTTYEIIISFIISSLLSFFLALLFYIFKNVKKIFTPYIILINSLPKIALGPLIIIWIGANKGSIIFNGVIISFIITMNTILNGMLSTNSNIIKLFKIYGVNKFNILRYLIIPSSKKEIVSALKLNLGLCEIGVIMGEFLSCKSGIGYLILYGTQVFNLSLVGAGIFLLLLLSFIFSLLIK